MKSWGSLSRHGTARDGRDPARSARRMMPRLHSHRVAGRMSEFAAGEPVGPTERPAQPTDLPMRALEPAVQSPQLPVRPSHLRRLFTNFGYLVAKQGATAVLGLAYWAVATHLFSARDIGLAAAASSAAFFLAAIG